MKNIIKNGLIVILSLILTISCKDDPSYPDLKIEKTSVQMLEEATNTVSLSGGDNTKYEVISLNPEVAKVELSGKTITIKALKQGKTTIKIASAGKLGEIQVVVLPKRTEVGVYSLEGNSYFDVMLSADNGNGIWLLEKAFNPYEGKRFYSNFILNPTEGSEVELNIEVENIEGLSSGKTKALVEAIYEQSVQVKLEKYRLVLPIK